MEALLITTMAIKNRHCVESKCKGPSPVPTTKTWPIVWPRVLIEQRIKSYCQALAEEYFFQQWCGKSLYTTKSIAKSRYFYFKLIANYKVLFESIHIFTHERDRADKYGNSRQSCNYWVRGSFTVCKCSTNNKNIRYNTNNNQQRTQHQHQQHIFSYAFLSHLILMQFSFHFS